MASVSWPESSRKFVSSFCASPNVPSSTSRPRPTVAHRVFRERVAKSITGRYARCSGLRSSFSSAARRAAASSAPPRGRRNQYASTGMTVSDTSSEASSATVTVIANGAKSCPTKPPTRAIGANTATVVSVEAVTAPATSRTAVRIASRFGSPYSRCRLMFSSTTMESSTTRPTAMVSAPRVSRLSE